MTAPEDVKGEVWQRASFPGERRRRPQSAVVTRSFTEKSPYSKRIQRPHERRNRPTSAATLPPIVQHLLDTSTTVNHERSFYSPNGRPGSPTRHTSDFRRSPLVSSPPKQKITIKSAKQLPSEDEHPATQKSVSRLRRPSIFSSWTGYSTGTVTSGEDRSQIAQAKKLAAIAVREREWSCMKALEEANGMFSLQCFLLLILIISRIMYDSWT